jgi:hypothetical protein
MGELLVVLVLLGFAWWRFRIFLEELNGKSPRHDSDWYGGGGDSGDSGGDGPSWGGDFGQDSSGGGDGGGG